MKSSENSPKRERERDALWKGKDHDDDDDAPVHFPPFLLCIMRRRRRMMILIAAAAAPPPEKDFQPSIPSFESSKSDWILSLMADSLIIISCCCRCPNQ